MSMKSGLTSKPNPVRRVTQKQRFVVLLEEIKDEFRVVSESQKAVVKKLDGVEKRLEEMVTKTDLKIMLDQQSKDIGKVLSDHEGRILVLEAR